ncbi:MAG: DUF2026 domain-containing protein [Colwellia sp.]|nr:DUF2026 domain-containing protein [Colwellia sp.]
MKFELTLKQYELIYRVVASVGANFSHGAGSSCQFYNVNAAFILNKLLEVKARPVMGAAFILLNEERDVLSFAKKENGNFYSSPKAFHCWVETENYIIDFTAPEYREAALGLKSKQCIPRKMFQKTKNSMSNDPYSLVNVGDFYFSANTELTNNLLGKLSSSLGGQDLAKICLDWSKKITKKKISSLPIINDLGELTNVNLINSNLVSTW